jgi:hypothetical protein
VDNSVSDGGNALPWQLLIECVQHDLEKRQAVGRWKHAAKYFLFVLACNPELAFALDLIGAFNRCPQCDAVTRKRRKLQA